MDDEPADSGPAAVGYAEDGLTADGADGATNHELQPDAMGDSLPGDIGYAEDGPQDCSAAVVAASAPGEPSETAAEVHSAPKSKQRPKSPAPGLPNQEGDALNHNLSRVHRSPAYSFSGAPRPSGSAAFAQRQPKSSLPGPGSHDPHDPRENNTPKWGFGSTGRKTGPILALNAPGPGAYDPTDIKLHRSPAYSMGCGALNQPPKPRKLVNDPTPGPGGHFVGASIVHRAKPLKGEGQEAGEQGAAKAPPTGSAGFAANLDGAKDVDWEALSAKLPTGKDERSKARRKELWKHSDPNGNGYLSSAEVDLMVRDTVGEAMFSAKPVIQQAFHAARRTGGGEQTGRAADYIEANEFRTLLVALRQYYELYAMFNRLDVSDDRRISFEEFTKEECLEKLKRWGVQIAPDQAQAEFDAIDTDGGGMVLFDEFAKWAIQKSLDLEDDDDFADESAAKLEAVGYMEERESKFKKLKGGIIQKEPAPQLCYTHKGAEVPLQTMARAEPTRSPNRAHRTVEFPPEGEGGLPIVGGLPMRRLKPGSKFITMRPIPPHGAPAGLPYALGQLLMEKAKEDRESKTPKTRAAQAAAAIKGAEAASPKKLKSKKVAPEPEAEPAEAQ